MTEKRGWEDVSAFAEACADQVLAGYTHCLVSDQDRYVEAWCEKHTLRKIIEGAAWPYCVRCVFSIGFQSTTFLMSLFDQQKEIERDERERMEQLRAEVQEFIRAKLSCLTNQTRPECSA